MSSFPHDPKQVSGEDAEADGGRGKKRRSSLVGGGGATLPTGFADMTLDSLDECFDKILHLGKRAQRHEDYIKKLMLAQRETRLGIAEVS